MTLYETLHNASFEEMATYFCLDYCDTCEKAEMCGKALCKYCGTKEKIREWLNSETDEEMIRQIKYMSEATENDNL